jgi:acetyl esterase/lipase
MKRVDMARWRAFGPTTSWARATATAVCLALLSLTGSILAGCGGGSAAQGAPEGGGVTWYGPSHPIRGVSQRIVGSGAGAAALLWRKGKPPPAEAVVFLHAWLPWPPSSYGPWLRHLARRGNTVIYPVYQQMGSKPEDLLGNAIAGIAAGLRAAHVGPSSLVVVGDTTGGALAFDYSAVATERGVPGPGGVLAAYPGRNPPGGEIPSADLSHIPRGTLLEAIAGPGDLIPSGEAQARGLLAGATAVSSAQRRYLTAPRLTGPSGTGPPSRRAFWVPFDRLIAAVRGSL